LDQNLSSLFLKLSTESAEITDSGRLFQIFTTRASLLTVSESELDAKLAKSLKTF